MEHEEFETLCRLARLDVTDEERERLRGEFGRILAYVEALRAVPTEGVEPTAQAHPLPAAERPDEERPGADRGEVLRAAPSHDGACFTIPHMMDDTG